jgi:phage baseplate assembly protein V
VSILASVRSLLTRGRIAMSVLNPKRTLVQLTGLADEVKDQIELMLPYGMSALPDAGDVVMLQIGGSRAHLVALCGDNPALRIPDLVKGEFGFRDLNGQQIVFRTDKVEVTTPKDLLITVTGKVSQSITGDLDQTVNGQTVLTCDNINLGGTGGKKVALDGDPVVDGKVVASSQKVKAL